MIKTIFLVPVRDNDGRPFPRSAWRALEDRLLQFGGFSFTDGVYGTWQFGGRMYRDRSRRYTVSLTSWMQLPASLELVHWVRGTFRQEAIYVEVAGVPEIVGGAE
jgi:hypothetical protein